VLIPWNTDAPIYHYPIATAGLIACNVAVFALLIGEPELAEEYCLAYGDGLHPVQWLTHNFLHADFMHLFGNMIFLWSFGLVVEGKLGWYGMLPAYLGVGIAHGWIVQAANQHHDGLALGASAAIYGLMAMSLVWAPRNNMECVLLLGRVHMFELSILVLSGIYIGLDFTSALWAGFEVSTPVLHLTGALIGAALGLALLKLNLVDCEGWDVISVWRGEVGKAQQRRKKQPAQKPEEREADQHAKTQAALQHLRNHLEARRLDEALQLHGRMHDTVRSWQLPQKELLALIQQLQAAKRWSDSIPLLVEYLRHFDQHAITMRLQLAQILVTAEEKPLQALAVLEKLPKESLPQAAQQRYEQISRKARQLQDEGAVEFEPQDW
jgi:membrane associated rhomboid family serine protease